MRTAETDPRLVRLVTRHFNDLQGLRLVAFGPAYAAASWGWLATGREMPVLLWGGATMVLGFAAMSLLDRFYSSLGRVKVGRRESAIRISFGAITVVLLRMQEHAMPGAPSILWLLCSLYPLWLAVDGWPFRWHHLLTVASMLYVAFGRAADPDPSAFAWMAPRMWAFSLALVVAGLADHALLIRLLRSTRAAAAERAS